ncbi:MAG TPA: hypothetical protein VNQ53_07870 [Nocardioides sp.]|nr:hypothetical protein [Nocardioides sp.]
MLRYAARAVPWARVGVAGVLVLVLMDVVRRWPWTMWPLEGIAIGLLAAGTAWCFDEPAAEVVDSAPRHLAWRTGIRASGVLLLLAAWAVAVLRARESLFGHPWAVALQGSATVIAAAAYATCRRAYGEPAPGRAVGLVVVPAATFWALIRPLADSLPIFPYADGSVGLGSWEASIGMWLTVAGIAILLLLAALADTRWWRLRPAVRRGRR